jgi:hypothetical protein
MEWLSELLSSILPDRSETNMLRQQQTFESRIGIGRLFQPTAAVSFQAVLEGHLSQ